MKILDAPEMPNLKRGGYNYTPWVREDIQVQMLFVRADIIFFIGRDLRTFVVSKWRHLIYFGVCIQNLL